MNKSEGGKYLGIPLDQTAELNDDGVLLEAVEDDVDNDWDRLTPKRSPLRTDPSRYGFMIGGFSVVMDEELGLTVEEVRNMLP